MESEQNVEALPPVPSPVEVGGSYPTSELPAPLLDDCNPQPDIMMSDPGESAYPPGARPVRPYGGGHPWDWPWGCGGSPFRTGPGCCDTWRVGGRWDVSVDGMVLRREGTDLQQIWNETDAGQGIPELFEQFDYAPGGRVSFIGRYPHVGYRVQGAYEGVEKWDAVITYPKQDVDIIGIVPDPASPGDTLEVPIPATQQRRVNYTSNLHSGEINIIKCEDNAFQPYCGVRYIRFADELRIIDDQQATDPLTVLLPPPNQVLTTDMTNLFDLQNNLMGFQIGVRNDYWQMTRRIGIEAFVNGGLYYNKVKYTNLMNVTQVQRAGAVVPVDTTNTNDFPGFTTVASSTNMDTSDLSEIAYSWEANISAVCRINKCWAMRAGYQVLWINGLRLADEAFLDPDIFLDNETHSLLFQGWHAGIECRR